MLTFLCVAWSPLRRIRTIRDLPALTTA